jgi:hypothetical protein
MAFRALVGFGIPAATVSKGHLIVKGLPGALLRALQL